MKIKLRHKVVLANIAIVLPLLLFVSFIVTDWLDNHNLNAILQHFKSQSQYSQRFIDEYVKGKGPPENVFETDSLIIHEKLRMVTGSDAELWTLSQSGETDELVKRALRGRNSYLISNSENGRIFSYSFPVFSQSNIIGAIKLKYTLNTEDRMRINLLLLMLIITAAASIITLILSNAFSSKMISPLEKLKLLAADIALGNFRHTSDIQTGDEIQDLAISLESMGKSLEEMVAKQKHFFDNMTHEIRTPLTNISGFADLLTQNHSGDKCSEYAGYIRGEAARLLEMINNLLDMSRLGQYKEALDLSTFSLDELIWEVTGLFEPRAKKFGISFNLEVAPCIIRADSSRIKQLMMNIIDNAIKYSEGDIIRIESFADGNNARIIVKNNGKGIPKAELSKITEPFYRIDKVRSRSQGSSGLGLAICRQIVEMHNGTINIDSLENRGTTVTILLQLLR